MTGFQRGYALIIGIANYQNVQKLPAVVLKDARDMQTLLCSSAHCGYPKANVRLLLDQQATADAIRDAMRWLSFKTTPEDTALVFFSGHGGHLARGTQELNFLLPHECDPENIKGTGLSGDEVTDLVRTIQAQRLVVIFDCCFAGGIGEVKGLDREMAAFKTGLTETYYSLLAEGRGRVILASSRDDEISLILPEMDNSLFTHHLLEALRGSAHTRGDGLIRVLDVFVHVSETVPKQANQHPILKANDVENNFPVSLFLGGKMMPPTSTNASAANTVRTMHPSNLAMLRNLIVTAFDDNELMFFCQNYFPDVINQFSPSISTEMKAFILAGYCDRRGLLSDLLKALKAERPLRYSEFIEQEL